MADTYGSLPHYDSSETYVPGPTPGLGGMVRGLLWKCSPICSLPMIKINIKLKLSESGI